MAEAESPFRFDPTHINDAALTKSGYVYYEGNRTLSNGTKCYLAFEDYAPLIFPNGTFINATSCYAPINPIKLRGILALVFGSLFALMILVILINLRKHGKTYLPLEKGWSVVGRRWQWYWMLFVSACGTISCFTAVDVDRDYVLGLPISLQSLFLTLMNPGLNAAVWEAARHWGSFEQRQQLEADPFAFTDGDLRSRFELYAPLLFYALDWLVFFLTIPRSWSTVQKQRSPSQAILIAAPAATDLRFKAGSIASLACFLLICFSLAHSKFHYRASILRTAFPAAIFGLAWRVSYWVASAWRWDMNPFNLETDLGWQYSLDYLCAFHILLALNIRGQKTENDDKIIIAQRVLRGQVSDAYITSRHGRSKPSWWSRSAIDHRNDVQGNDDDLEMRVLGIQAKTFQEDESGSWWWQRRQQKKRDSDDNQTDDTGSSTYIVKGSSMLEPEDPPLRKRTSQTLSERSNYSTFDARPQVVKSMLDI